MTVRSDWGTDGVDRIWRVHEIRGAKSENVTKP